MKKLGFGISIILTLLLIASNVSAFDLDEPLLYEEIPDDIYYDDDNVSIGTVRAVAFDPNDGSFIYVADALHDRVLKLSNDGEYLDSFGSYGDGDGEFQFVGKIHVDGESNIYVTSEHRYQKFDSEGNHLFTVGSATTAGTGDGEFNLTNGVTTDDDLNIYVADYNNNRVQKFDSSGTFISSFGSSGSGNGQFNKAIGPYYYDGHIYIADWNDRIQKFDTDGNYVSQFGSAGSGDGEFNNPSHVFVDGENSEIFVLDYYNHRVQVFDMSGVYKRQFGSVGYGQAQLRYPAAVAVRDGIAYVAAGYQEMKLFNSADGSILKVWSMKYLSDTENGPKRLGGSYIRVGLGPDGYVYTTDDESDLIRKYQVDGTYVGVFGEQGTDPDQYHDPDSIFVDDDGYVYVADYANNMIQKFDSDGNHVLDFDTAGFDKASGVWVDKNGKVYGASQQNNIHVFNADGSFDFKLDTAGSNPGEFGNTVAIYVDEDLNIYVLDGLNNMIHMFDSTGNFIELIGSNEEGDDNYVGQPYMIQKDSEGNYYIADVRNGVLVLDSNESFLYRIGGETGSQGFFEGDFSAVQDLFLDEESQRLFIADQLGRIRVFSFAFIDLDNEGPTGSLTIENSYVSSQSITVTLSATDNMSGVSEMLVSNSSNFGDSIWETYSITKMWSLLGVEGQHTVFVKLRDTVGNESDVLSLQLTLDTLGPEPGMAISTHTNIREITVQLSATDSSPLTSYQLSENSSFDTAEWATFADSALFTLSDSDGTKTLFVRYKDAAGNISETYSASIILDRIAPPLVPTKLNTLNIVQTISDYYWTSGKLTIVGTTEALATVQITVNSDPVTCVTTADANGDFSCTFTENISDGSHTVSIVSTDQAGNVTTYPNLTLGVRVGLAQTGSPAGVLVALGALVILSLTGNLAFRKISNR